MSIDQLLLFCFCFFFIRHPFHSLLSFSLHVFFFSILLYYLWCWFIKLFLSSCNVFINNLDCLLFYRDYLIGTNYNLLSIVERKRDIEWKKGSWVNSFKFYSVKFRILVSFLKKICCLFLRVFVRDHVQRQKIWLINFQNSSFKSRS